MNHLQLTFPPDVGHPKYRVFFSVLTVKERDVQEKSSKKAWSYTWTQRQGCFSSWSCPGNRETLSRRKAAGAEGLAVLCPQVLLF